MNRSKPDSFRDYKILEKPSESVVSKYDTTATT
jgi:hypothetical protein